MSAFHMIQQDSEAAWTIERSGHPRGKTIHDRYSRYGMVAFLADSGVQGSELLHSKACFSTFKNLHVLNEEPSINLFIRKGHDIGHCR